MGPEEPWHLTSRQDPPPTPPPLLNLFVTSSPDSLALPGMFLIVAFSPVKIFITAQWQQIVSIKGLFRHYLQKTRRRWGSSSTRRRRFRPRARLR